MRPTTIYRCECGAMVASDKAMLRHLNGKTICQRRKMAAYSFNGRLHFPDDNPEEPPNAES